MAFRTWARSEGLPASGANMPRTSRWSAALPPSILMSVSRGGSRYAARFAAPRGHQRPDFLDLLGELAEPGEGGFRSFPAALHDLYRVRIAHQVVFVKVGRNHQVGISAGGHHVLLDQQAQCLRGDGDAGVQRRDAFRVSQAGLDGNDDIGAHLPRNIHRHVVGNPPSTTVRPSIS